MIRRKPPTKVWFSVKTITATEFLVWKVHYSLCIRYFVCALGGYRLAWWIFIERGHCMDVRISGRPIFLPFDDWNNFLLIKNTQKDGDLTQRGAFGDCFFPFCCCEVSILEWTRHPTENCASTFWMGSLHIVILLRSRFLFHQIFSCPLEPHKLIKQCIVKP